MEKFRNVIEKHDELILSQQDFCIGRSTVRLKFHSGDVEIDHKSGAGHSMWCNVDYHLQQSRGLISVNGMIASFRTFCSSTVNSLTFGIYRHCDEARKMTTTCPNGRSALTAHRNL
ncbi:hypothetical protein TNIN_317501 [Trichonephila inaurata madagascariensis]|uniref:Uncharacterized protein n=1 Tax=Trichonephila inaurata madagascariensis TaxID=2747483 RepID=A0A8X6X2N7_9ARAC|nr:hypothetical protein TNIN_317501 [Trichonephila inaurata madagascariensis]